MAYPDTDVVLLCFSVVRRDSMENIKSKWMPELIQHLPNVPIILVGTQVDLRVDLPLSKGTPSSSVTSLDKSLLTQLNNTTSTTTTNSMTTATNSNLTSATNNFVSTSEGHDLKQKIKAYDYIECSALTQLNIKEVFETSIEAVLRTNKEEKVVSCCFHSLLHTLIQSLLSRFNRKSSTNNKTSIDINNNQSTNKKKVKKNSSSSSSKPFSKYIHR
jgi:GTPase SAR1 family protein